jgi:hypothetical protein
MLIIEWRAAWGKDLTGFVWTAWFTLAASSLIGVAWIILSAAGINMILATWNERWGILGRWLVVSACCCCLGIWAGSCQRGRGAAPDANVLLYFLMPLTIIICIGCAGGPFILPAAS